MIAALNAAEAGANLARNWADVVASNLASAGLPRAKNTTVDLVAAEKAEQQRVEEVVQHRDPTLVFAPGYPTADDAGYVELAPVDPKSFVDLGASVRQHEANLAVLRVARDAYAGAQRLAGASG
jgi:flagellar basal body rod protein FlgC